jgi:hypothetical protein
MNRRTLSRILFFDELHRLLIPAQGVITEFGVRRGQDMVLFSNLRGIYEPFNGRRKVIGFDTFEGFSSVRRKDGWRVAVGDDRESSDFEDFLQRVLGMSRVGVSDSQRGGNSSS